MNFKRYRVDPGGKVKLAEWDVTDKRPIDGDKTEARARLDFLRARLGELQDVFFADRRYKLLIVLQGMDTAGKDSTIRHVFQTVDPLGVRVSSFRAPNHEEAARDYLWRVHRKVPGNGEIVIFNRSHYEDVLVPRVEGWIDKAEWQRRYRQINDFERLLAETGTLVLKFFLHISKDEQKKRLLERRDNPDKQWKLLPEDLVSRSKWDAYQTAYDDLLVATSSEFAPWYVIPANHKLARNLLVSELLVETLDKLDLRHPQAIEGVEKLVIE